jgi:hypothetical protein
MAPRDERCAGGSMNKEKPSRRVKLKPQWLEKRLVITRNLLPF